MANKFNLNWNKIVQLAWAALAKAGKDCSPYRERLEYELYEIDKQGSNQYWLNIVNEDKIFATNPNKLLLPWLLYRLGVKLDDGTCRKLTGKEWEDADPVANRDRTKDGPLTLTSRYSDVMEQFAKDGKLPVDLVQDADKPDIDLDCLPEARDPIKDYAARKYGEETQGTLPDDAKDYGYVCSVGTWQTYLLRSAIIDVWKAMDMGDKDVVLAMTTELPDEVDELKDGGKATCKNRLPLPNGETKECGTVHSYAVCPTCGSDSTDTPTLGRLVRDYKPFSEFYSKHPAVVDFAVGLVGRIKTMGQHAGGLIIADRQLYGNIPLGARITKDKDGNKIVNYVSTWTEGRSTQLSKFGYNKWDILGLKNLQYIKTCCELIEQNRGISFGPNLEGWDDVNPEKDQAGWFINKKNGKKYKIQLNDAKALGLANAQLTDAIFQFDTDLAKRNLGHGVRNFEDLMLLNAMGHPGPMDCVAPHSPVLTDVGEVPVSELDPSRHKIAYLSESGPAYTDKYLPVETGVKQLFRVTLKDGRKLELSATHRILTESGYKAVKDLTPGDKIVEFY